MLKQILTEIFKPFLAKIFNEVILTKKEKIHSLTNHINIFRGIRQKLFEINHSYPLNSREEYMRLALSTIQEYDLAKIVCPEVWDDINRDLISNYRDIICKSNDSHALSNKDFFGLRNNILAACNYMIDALNDKINTL